MCVVVLWYFIDISECLKIIERVYQWCRALVCEWIYVLTTLPLYLLRDTDLEGITTSNNYFFLLEDQNGRIYFINIDCSWSKMFYDNGNNDPYTPSISLEQQDDLLRQYCGNILFYSIFCPFFICIKKARLIYI